MKIGILNRATKASSETKVAQIHDAVGLALDEIQTLYIDKWTDDQTVEPKDYINASTLAKSLDAQDYELYKCSCIESKYTVSGSALTEDTGDKEHKLGNNSTGELFIVSVKGSGDGLVVKFINNDDATTKSYGVKVEYPNGDTAVKTK